MARTAVALYDVDKEIISEEYQIIEEDYPPRKAGVTIQSGRFPLPPLSSTSIIIADSAEAESVNSVIVKPYSFLQSEVSTDITEPYIPLDEKLDRFTQLMKPVVSFDPDCDVTPLFSDGSGRLLSFIAHQDGRRIIVIPPLSEKEQYGQLFRLLLKLKQQKTEYTSQSDKWKKLQEKRANAEERLSKGVAEIESEIRKSFPESVFLSGLRDWKADNFEEAVKAFFTYLGVERDDNMLLQCKVTTSEVDSISSLLRSLQKEKKSGRDVHGILVANAYRYLPSAQKRQCFDKTLIKTAENNNITLLSGEDLLSLYWNLESGIISRGWVKEQLFKSGMCTFDIPEENYISTISKRGKEDSSLCRFTLDGKTIRKSMKVIIKSNDGKLRVDVITSLSAGKVPMAEAQDGEVTVKFLSSVEKGERVYFTL